MNSRLWKGKSDIIYDQLRIIERLDFGVWQGEVMFFDERYDYYVFLFWHLNQS